MNIIAGIVNRILRRRGVSWDGDYPDWTSAEAACSKGYASDLILQRVIQATRDVESGKAVYERDSVTFDRIHYTWPLLSALNFAAARAGGRLNVLDFGGALGSSYRQNKRFLDYLPEVNWCVVEQPAFVDAGKEEFTSDVLHFAHTIEEAISDKKPDIVLLPSVLQYLEEPWAWLEQLAAVDADVIYIDRTLISMEDRDRLTVQSVPPDIYEAAYPCWFLSEQKMMDVLNEKYMLLESFTSDFNQYVRIRSKAVAAESGYIFVRKELQ